MKFSEMSIVDLKQKRAALVDSLEQYANIAEKRTLTDSEREQVKQIRDQVETIDPALREKLAIEQEQLANLAGTSNAVNLRTSANVKHFGEAMREVRAAGGSRRVAYDAQAFYTRAMTPASNSAGKTAYTGTSSLQLAATEDISWLDKMNLIQVTRNGQIVPFVSRANRLTAQTKGYTDELTGQAYTVDAYTVSLSNYYTYLEVHNDVLRDAADMNLEAMLYNASRGDILRQIAKDVLTGASGSNNLVGIQNTSGIQTIANAGTAIADYSLIVEAVQKLMTNANVMPENVAVIMHPVVWQIYADLYAATDGQPLQRPAQIANVPFYAYNRIPVNLGTGEDETLIFAADFSRWNLYTEGFYEISTSAGPNMKRDYSDIAVTYRADLATIDPASVVLVTGVPTA